MYFTHILGCLPILDYTLREYARLCSGECGWSLEPPLFHLVHPRPPMQPLT